LTGGEIWFSFLLSRGGRRVRIQKRRFEYFPIKLIGKIKAVALPY